MSLGTAEHLPSVLRLGGKQLCVSVLLPSSRGKWREKMEGKASIARLCVVVVVSCALFSPRPVLDNSGGGGEKNKNLFAKWHFRADQRS